MSNLSKTSLDFIRRVIAPYNTRPLGILKFTDPELTDAYSVAITSTTIAISDGTDSYTVSYVGKTSRQIATELGASQFPVKVSAIADVDFLKESELIASGSVIPTTFDLRDRTADSNSCIVRVKRWAVSNKNLTAINIRPPYRTGPQLPWWIRINAGEFWQKIKGVSYKFSVPEYSDQVWSSKYGRPFRDVSGEQANFVGKNKIRLSRRPILWKNNISISAGVSDRVYSSGVIKDVDAINGIIYLKPGTNIPEDSLVDYTYLERNYIYKGINLNGHFGQNPYILDKYIVVYLRPTQSSSGISRSQGVYHQIGESLEDAIYSIEEADVDEPITLIGAFNVRSSFDKRDVEVTDTRSYGGGLKEDDEGLAAQRKFPQSQYFFDIGRQEGIPYPGAAAIVVELPAELKEVLTVSELQEKAKKYMAAGVYPVFKYPEEQYEEQFKPAYHYNADISLFSTEVEAAYSGAAATGLGGTDEAAYWWDTDVELPEPFEQTIVSGWDATDIVSGATVNTGELSSYLQLTPGRSYYQKYIKSAPDAIFSWEERDDKGQWERRTFRDTREVAKDHLIGGELHIDASLGYKEVRNLKAISPMMLPGTGLWERYGTATSKILKRIGDLSSPNYSMTTGSIDDIQDFVWSTKTRVLPGEVAAVYEPIVEHYPVMSGLNFWSGASHFLTGLAEYAYDSTTQDNTTTGEFPYIWDVSSSTFSGAHDSYYNAARDLHLFARTTTMLVNEYASTATGNDPAVVYPGLSHIDSSGDLSAGKALSGALQVYRAYTVGKLNGTYNSLNSDLISPYYIPATNAEVPLAVGSNSGDIYNNDDHLSCSATKAFAALYAAQVAPTTAETTGEVAVIPISEDPKSLALSGIGHRLSLFTGHFVPFYTGAQLSSTWLNQYDRLSEYAGNVLYDVASSFDYLLYGNDQWAGAINCDTKSGPYYHSSSFNIVGYKYDYDFFTGEITTVEDGQTVTKREYLYQLINKYQDVLDSISETTSTVAKRGGLTAPGHGKLINCMAWHTRHSLRGDELFSGEYGDLESVFNIGAESYIKSSISSEGKIWEQGSFGWNPIAYTGEIPSDLFKVCSSAIEIEQLRSNTTGANRWMTIAGGILANTTGQYEYDGGYPSSTVFSTVNDIPGEPGSIPLAGMLSVLGRKTGEFTPEEFTAITGAI